MTGAIPVFLPPTRNHLGHHRPDPARGVLAGRASRSGSTRTRSRATAKNKKPRILTLTQSTYDGIAYNVEMLKATLGDSIETLHFDEAWLPHAAFHEFYRDMHAIGKDRPRSKDSLIFATHSTHKLLAGISQASQIIVQNSETRKLDLPIFNEAYLMHTSTSPQYAIIASCDVSAAMMEPPGGTALVEESIVEALDFRRAMRKVDDEWGKDWWFKVWGPDRMSSEGIKRDDWILRANEKWHGFGDLAHGLQHPRPDQGDDHHAGPRRVRQVREDGHPGVDRHQVPGRARRDRREDRALLVLHHVHDRHHEGPLEHAASPRCSSSRTTTTRTSRCGGSCPSSARSSRATSASACATCASRSTRCTRRTTSRA